MADGDENGISAWHFLCMPFRVCSDVLMRPFRGRVKYEPGPDGISSGSIITYDVNFLLNYGWATMYKGTFLNVATFQGVIVGIALTTLLSLFKCTGSNTSYCISFLPVAGGTSNITLTALVAFLEGLFINTLLNRWWALRMHVLGHVGLHNQVVIQISSALANGGLASSSPRYMEKARKAINSIYRYLSVANYLVIMDANDDKDFISLYKKGLLTQFEYLTLQTSSGSPNVVYGWVDTKLQKLADAGYLGSFPGVGDANLQSILDVVGKARANCIAVGVYIHTQLPYPLMQLISLCTYLFFFQVIAVAAGNIGDAYQKTQYGVMLSYFYTMVLTLIVFRSFIGVYNTLYNPLGDDTADFPSSSWLAGGDKSYTALINNIFDVSISKEVASKLSFSVDEGVGRDRTSLRFNQASGLKRRKTRSKGAEKVDPSAGTTPLPPPPELLSVSSEKTGGLPMTNLGIEVCSVLNEWMRH